MPRKQKPNQIGISFTVDKNIHKELTKKAKDNNMSLANYLIFCGMNAEITVSIEQRKNQDSRTSVST